jgi:hypothetical protein
MIDDMPKTRVLQYIASSAACCVALGLAVAGIAMFRESSLPADASVWRLLLDDRLSLGFIRLGAVAGAIYMIASVPALVVGGRWLRAVGPSGLTADELSANEQRFRDLEARYRRVKKERDQLRALFDAARGG